MLVKMRIAHIFLMLVRVSYIFLKIGEILIVRFLVQKQ